MSQALYILIAFQNRRPNASNENGLAELELCEFKHYCKYKSDNISILCFPFKTIKDPFKRKTLTSPKFYAKTNTFVIRNVVDPPNFDCISELEAKCHQPKGPSIPLIQKRRVIMHA
jgi:hypothetical protein